MVAGLAFIGLLVACVHHVAGTAPSSRVTTNAYFTARIGDTFVIDLIDERNATCITHFTATVSSAGVLPLNDAEGHFMTNLTVVGQGALATAFKIFNAYGDSTMSTNIAVSVSPPDRLKTSPIRCNAKFLKSKRSVGNRLPATVLQGPTTIPPGDYSPEGNKLMPTRPSVDY